MPDIIKIKELINNKAKVSITIDNGVYVAELKEMKEPTSIIRVAGIPQNSIIINLDDFFPEPNQIFASKKHECCRADFILISSNGDDKQIVFIELKGGDVKKKHVKDQMRGAECFSRYVVAILDIFWQYSMPLQDYKKHYVLCKYTSSNKRTTDYSLEYKTNDTLDSILTTKGSHTFQYNQFIARKPR